MAARGVEAPRAPYWSRSNGPRGLRTGGSGALRLRDLGPGWASAGCGEGGVEGATRRPGSGQGLRLVAARRWGVAKWQGGSWVALKMRLAVAAVGGRRVWLGLGTRTPKNGLGVTIYIYIYIADFARVWF